MVRLLDDPWLVLPRYILPVTAEQAREYLVRRMETAALLSVCQRHLPRLAGARIPYEQDELLPQPNHPYSKGEHLCLELIEAHLFPFALEYLEMGADEGERMATIPLHSFGIDIWHLSYDPDRETWAGWLMLALLNRNLTLAQCQEFSPVPLDQQVWNALEGSLLFVRSSWSYEVLEQVCQQAPAPLSSLPTACRLLDHCTNNLFLDPGEEESVDDAAWTVEDMDLLIEEWKEAKRLMDEAHLLVAWLTAHPQEFRKVVDLWNLAQWMMCMPAQNGTRASANRPNDPMPS